MEALTAEGGVARFVGGCVRNTYLERNVEDVDIATSEPPERVMAPATGRRHQGGADRHEHGTITAVVSPEHYEITTLREDVESHGRHATVAYTDDWAADAARRDLTMNALFLDPDGTLYDPFDGLKDLRCRPCALRWRSPKTDRGGLSAPSPFLPFSRILRTCRARCGGPGSLSRARSNLAKLSAERVWAETRKLLLAPEPHAVFALMAG